MSLRQNLYQVQETLLQKLYEISRQCVKLWVHQQLSNLQKLWDSDFKLIKDVQQDIQKNQIKLQEYESLLQDLNKSFKQSKQAINALSLFQKGIYSAEINKSVAQTSQKVKQVVSKSQQLANNICRNKIFKANSLNDIQLTKDENRLGKTITNTLKNLFNPTQIIMTPKKQSQQKLQKKGFDIGQKIKSILNRSQQKEPQTTRQQIIKEFQYSDKFVPYSHRKTHQNPVIKNNEKDFQQFKYEFEKRKRNFIDQSNYTEKIQTKKGSHFQKPISQKSDKKTTFDQKLSNLFKKITQQKQEQPQDTNRSSIQTNYFNDYNDLIRKKKQQNRQNFFRYSIQ